MRDLTVLFYLGWLGFAAREGDRELAALEHKGRDFTREDLALVVERQRRACARVLPLYRKLAARGQVELSASPFYHPIVPLLVDTRARAPRACRPRRCRRRSPIPGDADAQIARGAEAHARAFGARPRGMWPPEGSVSPEAVAAYARAGVGWLATDEGNLWRSLGAAGEAHGRGDLYRAVAPRRRRPGVPRSRASPTASASPTRTATRAAGVGDLLARARHAAALSTAPAGEPPLVPIFLDGENPWESYPGLGRAVPARALRRALAAIASCAPRRSAEHLDARAGARRAAAPALGLVDRLGLPHLDRRSDQEPRLGICSARARARFDRARRRGRRRRAQRDAAYDHLLAAEGSDWFWWFGEPFHSMEDALFDALFRAHLAGAYRALGLPPPRELDEPVAAQQPRPPTPP